MPLSRILSLGKIKRSSKRLVRSNKYLARLFRQNFYGLNNLDAKVLDYFDYKGGYFVEIGANDGISQSNTKHFELFKDWRGILIEPSPINFQKLKLNRNSKNTYFNCACVSLTFPGDGIKMIYSNLMTTPLEGENDLEDPISHAIAGENFSNREKSFEFVAKTRTLQSIFEESESPRIMDFLSLDVEGAELEVLRGINHQEYGFKFILVETRSPVEMKNFLELNNYDFLAQLSHHDYMFRHRKFRAM